MPATLRQVRELLAARLPGLQLESAERPVTLLAQVPGGGATLTLANDDNIVKLVREHRPAGRANPEYTVKVEVRELFGGAHWVELPFASLDPPPHSGPSAPSRALRSPQVPACSPTLGSKSPKATGLRVKRPGSAGAGWSVKSGAKPAAPSADRSANLSARSPAQVRGASVRTNNSAAPSPGALKPAAAASMESSAAASPAAQKPVFKAATLRSQAPSPASLASTAATSTRHQTLRSSPMSPTSPTSPAWRARPQSAPLRGRAEQPPSTFDGRPGQRHDEAWRTRPEEKRRDSNATQLMDAIGLKEQYEQLKCESGRRKAALELLLRTRNSVPGARSIYLNADASIGGEDMKVPDTFNPEHWDKGEFCPIVGRDMPKVCEALRAFRQLEGITLARLSDEEACTVWEIADAAKRMLDPPPGSTPAGVEVSPSKVMLESPWLDFGESARIAFRLYPAGDATAKPGNTTVYAFMPKPPGLSFTFTLRVGAQLNTAPRLWISSKTNYRLDVKWSQVQEELDAWPAGERFPVTLWVVQWHGPQDDLGERQVEDRWSSSTALNVLRDMESHPELRRHSTQF